MNFVGAKQDGKKVAECYLYCEGTKERDRIAQLVVLWLLEIQRDGIRFA